MTMLMLGSIQYETSSGVSFSVNVDVKAPHGTFCGATFPANDDVEVLHLTSSEVTLII